jgi:DNA-binding transcriptional ArsR family regulator
MGLDKIGLHAFIVYRRWTITDPMAEQFAPDEERLALRLKALAHPARLRILEILAARGTCVCGEIVDVLPLAQATVSQHLKILKEAGLLQGTIDGPRSCYCLDATALSELRRAVVERLARVERGCCATLEPQKETTA